MEEHSIEAGVGSMLRFVTAQILAGAEIGICRGEVGIGKSFALSQIMAARQEKGVRVVFVTVTPAIEANINAFMRGGSGAELH
jgi:predicted ATP-dependent serine protease